MKKQIIFTTLCWCIALQTFMLSACSGDSTAKANSQDCTISAESETTSDSGDDSQSWEISFDNIPWGTDFASVKQMFPDLELSGITYEEMSPNSIIKGFNKVPSDSSSKVTLRASSNKLLLCDSNYSFEFEGHDLIDLVMYFVFETTDDGYIDYDSEKALLYGVNYRVEGSLGTLAEFAEKFRKVCGEPSQNYTIKKSSNNTDMQYLIWENDNYIISVHDEIADTFDSSFSGWDESIEISYAWKNGSKLLEQSKDALHNVKIKNAEK